MRGSLGGAAAPCRRRPLAAVLLALSGGTRLRCLSSVTGTRLRVWHLEGALETPVGPELGGRATGRHGFRPPSLPAPQPVPGSGVTTMNAEPAGSRRSLCPRGSQRLPSAREGLTPETRESRDEVGGEQVLRSETNKCALCTGAWRMTLKAEEDAPRPPRQPSPACGSFPRRPDSVAQSHRLPHFLGQLVSGSCQGAASGNIVRLYKRI